MKIFCLFPLDAYLFAVVAVVVGTNDGAVHAMVAKTNYLLHSSCFADRARAIIAHAHAPGPLGGCGDDDDDDDAVVANAAVVANETLVVAALVATLIHVADACVPQLLWMPLLQLLLLLLSLSHAVRSRG